MPQTIQVIFHTVSIQIAEAFAVIAVALCVLAYLRINGK